MVKANFIFLFFSINLLIKYMLIKKYSTYVSDYEGICIYHKLTFDVKF